VTVVTLPFSLLGRRGLFAVLALLAFALSGCRTLDGIDSADAGDPNTSGDGGGGDGGTRGEPPVVRQPPGVITVTTLAGSQARGTADGTGTAAQFDNPVGVAVAANGDLVVTEYEGKRVRRVTPQGATSLIFAGFADPFGVIVSGDTIFIQTDRDRDGRKGDATGTIWRLAGPTPEELVTGLGRPRGLVQIPDGRIVVSDRDRQTISILDPRDRSFRLLAGTDRVKGKIDADREVARFNEPYGLTLLPDGSVLVADLGNHCVRRVTLTGEVSTFAGEGNPGMKDDADKLKARFDGPQDVSADPLGNVYVSELNNARVRRITAEGAVETIAGDGTRGFVDGAGASARFFGLEQLEVTPDGKTIYVSDGTRGDIAEPYNRVRKIALP
jgi:DNA-binding beta-propeller fold protein YncE